MQPTTSFAVSACAVIAGVFVVGVGASAQADTSLVATGTATTGYSDNIQGVPESDVEGAPTVIADGFMDLVPGLAAAYETRRSIHNLSYNFAARLFFSNFDANSYTNNLGYQSLFNISPLSVVRVGAGFNAGRINNFDQAGSDAVGEEDVLPGGDVRFVSYNADISFRRQLSADLTSEVRYGAGRFIPQGSGDAATSNLNQEATLRIDRSFRYHLLGLQARALYGRQTEISTNVSQRSLTVGPSILWTWNISESFSSNASAGIDIVGEYPNLANRIYVPSFGGALTYSHERGAATIGANRGVQTNLFAGNTTILTNYFLTVGMPIPIKRPTAIASTASYALGDVIDTELGETSGTTERIGVDVGLTTELTRALRLGVRVESSKQIVTNVAANMAIEGTIRQTTGMIVLTGRYPEEMAGQVPPRNRNRVESASADFQEPVDNNGLSGGTGVAPEEGAAN